MTMDVPRQFSDRVSHGVQEIEQIPVSTRIPTYSVCHSIALDGEMVTSDGIGCNKACKMYSLQNNRST